MIDQIVVSMAATIAFAVLFHVPRSEYLLCGVNGAIGWMVYLFCTAHGTGGASASMWATLVLTLIARILSAVRKMPSTVFLITGIFTLVPGAGIYYTSYYLIMNDLDQCVAKGTETFKIAGAIVLGMIFGLILPQSWFNQLGKIRKCRLNLKK
ncbi:MAG: threonine/serine exporter [Lachnospiraceae bacterium]|nr:threonine/serine exporter [Lachnospiraceae bacterium]